MNVEIRMDNLDHGLEDWNQVSDLQHDHNKLPVVSKKVKHIHQTFENTVDGTMLVAMTSNAAMNLASKVTPINQDIPTNLDAVASGLWLVDLVNVFWWWKTEKRVSWQHTASVLCVTVRQILNSWDFLVTCFKNAALVIGNLPVIGLGVSALRMLGSGFSIWHDIKVYRKANKHMKVAKEQIDSLTKENKRIAKLFNKTLHKKMEFAGNDPKHRDKIRKKHIDDFMKEHLTEEERIGVEGKDYQAKVSHLSRSLVGRVEKYEHVIEVSKVEKKKAWVSIVGSVMNVAIGILAVLAIVGVGAMAATGWGMLVLGLAWTTYSLVTFFYQHSLNNSVRHLPGFAPDVSVDIEVHVSPDAAA